MSTGRFAPASNPIDMAFDLAFIGTILIHGRELFLLLGTTLVLLLHGIILRGERFPADRFGDACHAHVDRYSPRF